MRKLFLVAMLFLAACSKQAAPEVAKPAPVLKAVYFETGKAKIRPADEAVVSAAAKMLRSSDWWVIVLGLTDATGDFKTNQTLARERAEVVAEELRQRVDVSPPARIKPYAIGESLATGGSTQLERKVEFVFYTPGDESIEEIIVNSRVLTDEFRNKAISQ